MAKGTVEERLDAVEATLADMPAVVLKVVTDNAHLIVRKGVYDIGATMAHSVTDFVTWPFRKAQEAVAARAAAAKQPCTG